MKMKTKSQNGFTLIELVIGAAAAAIVILVAGMVIVTGQKSWNETWGAVNLQRDAAYAMLLMTRSIQAAASAETSGDSRILYIPSQSDPNITFTYAADTNNLQCSVGGLTQNIISGKVSNLQFIVTPSDNNVIIDLSLQKGEAQAEFKTTVMMRNYGG